MCYETNTCGRLSTPHRFYLVYRIYTDFYLQVTFETEVTHKKILLVFCQLSQIWHSEIKIYIKNSRCELTS